MLKHVISLLDTFPVQSFGVTYVRTSSQLDIRGLQFIIISTLESICQFSANLQSASADVYQYNDLWWPWKSSGLVRRPHPQHKLHPAWINSTPLKTFIDICCCGGARAGLSWPFSSRTPLQFNSNLEFVDVGWQFETSQWDADEHLHCHYRKVILSTGQHCKLHKNSVRSR